MHRATCPTSGKLATGTYALEAVAEGRTDTNARAVFVTHPMPDYPVVHLSDVHIGRPNRDPAPEAVFRRLLEQINGIRAAFVLITGDLTEGGEPEQFQEFLTLLEALQAHVVGPSQPDACSIDDFYYLARTTLVKDEKHFDKFDRAFAAYFKGVEMLTDFTKEIPDDWLRKVLEKELTPEQKAAIEKMGWDELMETLKKRLEEQKKRHQGGNKWIGTGGTSPMIRALCGLI